MYLSFACCFESFKMLYVYTKTLKIFVHNYFLYLLKDFLDNYVRRKVSKARLENWLYRPNTQTPQNSRSSSPGLLYSSQYSDNNGPPNGSQDTANNVKHHRASEPIQFSNNSPSSRNSSYGRLPLLASTTNLQSPSSNTLHLNISNKVIYLFWALKLISITFH